MSQEKKPLVSIITITYNLKKAGRENFFRQCVESIHNQDYELIEHLVIDGDSQDGTVDLLEEYAEKGWLNYVSEKDAGIYDAMNKGIKLAKGKYVAFLNSDDFYHDRSGIKISIEALERDRADFSFASVVNLKEKDQEKEELCPRMKHVFFTIQPCHQTMFVKRDVLIKEGMFNDSYKCVGDYDMTIRLCLKKYKGIFVDRAFSTYRLGGFSQEATNDGTVFKEVSRIYFENYNKLCQLTMPECEKICGDIYSPNIKDVPLKLAKALKNFEPYFSYAEYEKEVQLKEKPLLAKKNLFSDKTRDKIRFMVCSPKKFIKKYIKKIFNIGLKR